MLQTDERGSGKTCDEALEAGWGVVFLSRQPQ